MYAILQMILPFSHVIVISNIFWKRLQHNTKLTIEWFENNYMKLNEDKCHTLAARHRYETLWVNIGETRIWESKK